MAVNSIRKTSPGGKRAKPDGAAAREKSRKELFLSLDMAIVDVASARDLLDTIAGRPHEKSATIAYCVATTLDRALDRLDQLQGQYAVKEATA